MSHSLCPSGPVSPSAAWPFGCAPSPPSTDFSGNLILTSYSVVIAWMRTPFDPIRVLWNFCGIMQSIETCCSRSETISSMRDLAASTHSLAPRTNFVRKKPRGQSDVTIPFSTTLLESTPLRGKETVTPPYWSEISCNSSPRRATKCLWYFGSTCISSSTTLSCN